MFKRSCPWHSFTVLWVVRHMLRFNLLNLCLAWVFLNHFFIETSSWGLNVEGSWPAIQPDTFGQMTRILTIWYFSTFAVVINDDSDIDFIIVIVMTSISKSLFRSSFIFRLEEVRDPLLFRDEVTADLLDAANGRWGSALDVKPLTQAMEHFSRRRWTTIPAPLLSYSVHEGKHFCFSCEWTIS